MAPYDELYGYVKSPFAVLRHVSLHCDVALLRLVRETLRALHLELFTVPYDVKDVFPGLNSCRIPTFPGGTARIRR